MSKFFAATALHVLSFVLPCLLDAIISRRCKRSFGDLQGMISEDFSVVQNLLYEVSSTSPSLSVGVAV